MIRVLVARIRRHSLLIKGDRLFAAIKSIVFIEIYFRLSREDYVFDCEKKKKNTAFIMAGEKKDY